MDAMNAVKNIDKAKAAIVTLLGDGSCHDCNIYWLSQLVVDSDDAGNAASGGSNIVDEPDEPDTMAVLFAVTELAAEGRIGVRDINFVALHSHELGQEKNKSND